MDDAKPQLLCPQCGRKLLLPTFSKNSAREQISGTTVQISALPAEACLLCAAMMKDLSLSPVVALAEPERLWRFTYGGIL